MIGNGHAGFGRAASEKDPQGHLADVVPRPATHPGSAPSLRAASKSSRRQRSRSRGKLSSRSISCGVDWIASVANDASSSSSRSLGTSQGSAGRSSTPTHHPTRHTPTDTTMFDPFNDTRLRRRQDPPGHRKRESIRDLGYEQLPRQQRSLLDGELSRRNLVLRYPTREYEPDHASRNRQACRPLNRATAAKRRRPSSQALTNDPPYEPKAEAKLYPLLAKRRAAGGAARPLDPPWVERGAGHKGMRLAVRESRCACGAAPPNEPPTGPVARLANRSRSTPRSARPASA